MEKEIATHYIIIYYKILNFKPNWFHTISEQYVSKRRRHEKALGRRPNTPQVELFRG
jgi:hypothetical protein